MSRERCAARDCTCTLPWPFCDHFMGAPHKQGCDCDRCMRLAAALDKILAAEQTTKPTPIDRED